MVSKDFENSSFIFMTTLKASSLISSSFTVSSIAVIRLEKLFFIEIFAEFNVSFKSLILNFNLLFLKYSRPFLPPFFRLIPPARWAKQRMSRNPDLKFSEKANI